MIEAARPSPCQNLLVLFHGSEIRAILQHHAGLNPAHIIPVAPAVLSALRLRSDRPPRLELFNYLPRDLGYRNPTDAGSEDRIFLNRCNSHAYPGRETWRWRDSGPVTGVNACFRGNEGCDPTSFGPQPAWAPASASGLTPLEDVEHNVLIQTGRGPSAPWPFNVVLRPAPFGPDGGFGTAPSDISLTDRPVLGSAP